MPFSQKHKLKGILISWEKRKASAVVWGHLVERFGWKVAAWRKLRGRKQCWVGLLPKVSWVHALHQELVVCKGPRFWRRSATLLQTPLQVPTSLGTRFLCSSPSLFSGILWLLPDPPHTHTHFSILSKALLRCFPSNTETSYFIYSCTAFSSSRVVSIFFLKQIWTIFLKMGNSGACL